MKGLVLAGGSGKRLRPLTYSGAKQLVPIANRPILFYVIDNLVDAGVTDIAVIVSPETGAEVRHCVGDGTRWGASIQYILQDRPDGLAHALWVARDYLDGDASCVFLGDNLIGTRIRGAVKRFRESPQLDALVMLKEVDDPRAFGVAVVGSSGDVVRLVEKPSDPPSNLALVGIYLFRASIFDAVARIEPSPRGELEITDAISKLIEMGARVHFERVESWWLDTGKKDGLLLANETVLRDWLVGGIEGHVSADSTLSGKVRVEQGARVVRSNLSGPLVVGRDATIADSVVGPYVSIGDACTILGSRVERSVVLEGSRIENVRHLDNSLIGRRVTVSPGSAGGDTLSLLVGDDSRVELGQER